MIIINEIAWMGTSESHNDEWIELYNPSNQEVDLNGWQLLAQDNNPKIDLKGKIRPMAYFLLERTDDNSAANAKVDLIYTGALNNNGEHLQLIDAQGNVIDEVNALDGWRVGNNQTKQTMERINYEAGARSNDAGWQTSKELGGTPKAQNSQGAKSQPQLAEDKLLSESLPELAENESLRMASIVQTQEISESSNPNSFAPAKSSFVFVFLFGLIISILFAGLILFLKKKLYAPQKFN